MSATVPEPISTERATPSSSHRPAQLSESSVRPSRLAAPHDQATSGTPASSDDVKPTVKSPRAMGGKYGVLSAMIAYAVLLVSLSHMPIGYGAADNGTATPGSFWIEQAARVTLFTGLTTLVFLCFPPMNYEEGTGDFVIYCDRFLLISVGIALFALVNEMTQPLFGRPSELWNFLAACAAILPGASGFLVFRLVYESMARLRY